MSAHDFNSPTIIDHHYALFLWQEMVDAYRQVGVRTVDGLPSSARFRQMRAALSRQPSDAGLLVSRSIQGYGIRTIDLSRKFARYGNVPAVGRTKALPHGLSRPYCKQHDCRCQSWPRLAHLRRLRANTYPPCTNTLCRRTVRRRPSGCCLRPRFDDHRSLPFALSLGHVSPSQRGFAVTKEPSNFIP